MLLQRHDILSRPILKRCGLGRRSDVYESPWRCSYHVRSISVSCHVPSPDSKKSRGIRSSNASAGQWRHNSSQSTAQSKDFAVLGGGVTGMTTAYFLSEVFPKHKVVLFESKDVLGGWIRSTKIDVGDGEIIFEQGPRSLRPQPPNGTLALRLIQELDLVSDLLITSRSSPAARNRFIYYPDHLVRMPGAGSNFIANAFSNLRTLLTEPVFKNAFRGLLHDAGAEPRGSHIEDESVGDFVSRRFHPDIANNLVSALYHGIYAGDIFKLSAKQLMAQLWAAETRHGDIASYLVDQAFKKQSWSFCDDLDLHMKLQDAPWDARIRERIPSASVFTLKNGLGQLAEALQKRLLGKANVEVMRQTLVKKIEKTESGELIVSYSSSSDSPETTSTFSHLVSTIPPRALVPLLPEKNQSPLNTTLASNPAATVMVINLYFRTPSLLTTLSPPGGLPRTETGDIRGFGYLIPASVPFAQNPERALGVIFDSDISPDLWTTVPDDKQGTKLTVMMGGHWWDGWSSYPTEAEAKEMALDVLARHLGLVEEPVACNVSLQRDCIPQYQVGHAARMGRAHTALMEGFGGRLRVAGSWYSGVGVNDCLRAAFDVATGMAADMPRGMVEGDGSVLASAIREVAKRNDRTVTRGERTGLESFKQGRPMALVKRSRPGEVDILEVDDRGKEMGYFEWFSKAGKPREEKE